MKTSNLLRKTGSKYLRHKNSYSKHITKILLLNEKKNQSSYFKSRDSTNKTPTHDQSTTNFTSKYIIDRKVTHEILPMFISIELLPLS